MLIILCYDLSLFKILTYQRAKVNAVLAKTLAICVFFSIVAKK